MCKWIRIAAVGALATLTVLPVYAQPVRVSVEVETDRLIEGKHGELDRLKYFGLCDRGTGFFTRVPDEKEARYLLDTLNVCFGRSLGLCKGYTQASQWHKTDGIREDPGRPGYVEAASIRDVAKFVHGSEPDPMQRRSDILSIINHGHPGHEYPDFMAKHTAKGAKHWIPKNVDASAEYIVRVLDSTPAWKRPVLIEPFNEPHWNYLPDKIYQQWHLAIADKVHKHYPGIAIGGPCYSIAHYYRNGYEPFTKSFHPFIEGTKGELDFYSFHTYDFFDDDKESFTSGLRMESVLDLFDNYFRIAYKKPASLAMSEGGAAGKSFKEHLGTKKRYDYLAMLHNRSLNRFTMTYMQNPHILLKHVPFTLTLTDWDPTYAHALYRRDGLQKDSERYRTAFFDFYKLWKDVKGRRVVVSVDSPDVQAVAFVSDRTLTVCLNNLTDTARTVHLTPSRKPLSGRMSSYRPKGEEGELVEDCPLPDLSRLRLEADQCAVLSLRYASEISATAAVDERVFCGDRIIATIEKDKPNRFVIRAADAKKVRYATLRISVSRPAGVAVSPVVTFNGKARPVKLEDASANRNDTRDYATLKLVDIPASLVRTDNEVDVTFPDSGGAIGSVMLRAGMDLATKP